MFYSGDKAIGQQPVAQLTQTPWGHNLKIIAKCQSVEEAVYYVQNTLDNGWSRSVLTHQIESGLWQREGKAISNFNQTLPTPQSDLAQQALKDPYVFDFLTLSKQHSERELKQNLIEHAPPTPSFLHASSRNLSDGRRSPLRLVPGLDSVACGDDVFNRPYIV